MNNISERQPCRVLIVDDHADTTDSYRLLCELWGHEVRHAFDAESALVQLSDFVRDGAASSPIHAAFSVPVLLDGVAITSLACHYSAPHTPTRVQVERNVVFARLIAITLEGRLPFRVEKPICAYPDVGVPALA